MSANHDSRKPQAADDKTSSHRLDDSSQEAARLLNEPESVAKIADQAHAKARRAEKILKTSKRDVDTLIRLARAWATGKYKNISLASVAIVVGAVIYFVNPIDGIPDFLPLFGLSDDLSVIAFAIARLKREIDKFGDWETEITIHDSKS